MFKLKLFEKAEKKTEAKTIDKSELPADFDADLYIELYPHVKDTGLSAEEHYLSLGKAAGYNYQAPLGHVMSVMKGHYYEQDGLRTRHNHDFMVEPGFVRAYDRGLTASNGHDYNFHWRVHIALWVASTAARLDGDFVECGVNVGFMSSAIMEHLNWNSLNRSFYLLDTFGGIDERYVSDAERVNGVLEKNKNYLDSGAYVTDVEIVRRNFSEWSNVKIIVGSIPETLPQITSDRIAYVHIDLNCAPPEVASAEYLWSRIVPGGIILLDDYGFFGRFEQKRAMDGFASDHGITIVSLPTGQGMMIKPPQ